MEELISLTLPVGPSGEPVRITPPVNIPTGITLGGLATGFINVLLIIGIFLSLLYLIYGGWYWLQSKGDKQNLDKARRIIIYAILGLIVMSMSFIVVSLFAAALGVDTLLRGR